MAWAANAALIFSRSRNNARPALLPAFEPFSTQVLVVLGQTESPKVCGWQALSGGVPLFPCTTSGHIGFIHGPIAAAT